MIYCALYLCYNQQHIKDAFSEQSCVLKWRGRNVMPEILYFNYSIRGKMGGLQKGTGSTAWSCVGWLLLPDLLLQEAVLLNQDDLVTPNGATSSAPRFYPIVCLFGNLSRAVSPAGLLDVWKTEPVCKQMGMFPYFCLQLSGTWLRLTALRMLKKSAQKMPLQMQLESNLFLFTLISQDFFFFSLKPRSGYSDAQKGKVLGVCSCLSVLLLPQVGHLGFMVTLVWSFNPLLQQAPTALKAEAELQVRLCALSSTSKITPVTRGRESKRNFVIQHWEHSPGQGSPKLSLLLPSKVISSWLLKMCPSGEQLPCFLWNFPVPGWLHSQPCSLSTVTVTIRARVQDRQKTD